MSVGTCPETICVLASPIMAKARAGVSVPSYVPDINKQARRPCEGSPGVSAANKGKEKFLGNFFQCRRRFDALGRYTRAKAYGKPLFLLG